MTYAAAAWLGLSRLPQPGRREATMTNYAAGRRLEWAARNDLRKQGYTVIRSAGSKTPIDLIALNDREMIVIQVKKDAGDVAAAVASLAALALPAQVRREVWERERGGWRIVPVGSVPADLPDIPPSVWNFWQVLVPTNRSGVCPRCGRVSEIRAASHAGKRYSYVLCCNGAQLIAAL
jgi:hypothetical protein